jgi:hypothetical protein
MLFEPVIAYRTSPGVFAPVSRIDDDDAVCARKQRAIPQQGIEVVYRVKSMNERLVVGELWGKSQFETHAVPARNRVANRNCELRIRAFDLETQIG